MTLRARGWKPFSPWQVIARRGRGEAFVSSSYSAPTYAEARYKRSTLLLVKPPRGVPPWDSVEIRETDVAPKVRKG